MYGRGRQAHATDFQSTLSKPELVCETLPYDHIVDITDVTVGTKYTHANVTKLGTTA